MNDKCENLYNSDWYRFVWIFIFITVLVNSVFIFGPFLIIDDPMLYFKIAKNIVYNGEWIELFNNNTPWLDKPHLPFWLTAVSFKVFGTYPYAYILPGFIFYLIGALYTYKIAIYLYKDKLIAVFSVLIYFTIMRLMLSSIDLRAEAYLLGEITPASYYYLKYISGYDLKNLILGGFFTSLALMTKGPYTIITIVSGILALLIYKKQYKDLFSIRLLLMIFFPLVLTIPELFALYKQFGKEGITWFFIESQFGRFFNNGRITNNNASTIYFQLHTFFWAFLPWCVIFVVSLYDYIKYFKSFDDNEKRSFVFLLSSFFVTFIIFSLSKFQLDHYANIIFPFAAILSARFFCRNLLFLSKHYIFYVQMILSSLMIIISVLIIYWTSIKCDLRFIMSLIIPFMFIFLALIIHRKLSLSQKVIFYSVGSVNVLFIVLFLVLNIASAPLSAGYIIGKYISDQPFQIPVYEYQDSTDLDLYIKVKSTLIKNLNNLPSQSSYYLIIDSDELENIHIPDAKVVFKTPHMTTNTFSYNLVKSLDTFNRAKKYKILLKINS